MCGLVTKLWTSEIGPLSTFEEKKNILLLKYQEVLSWLIQNIFCVGSLLLTDQNYVYNIQGDYFNWPPLVQYQDDETPTSQPEALSDEGFHGTSALVGSLASKKITLYNVTLLLCLYMCGEQMPAV